MENDKCVTCRLLDHHFVIFHHLKIIVFSKASAFALICLQYNIVCTLTPCNFFDTICYTVFDLIGARGAYVNLFSTTRAKRSWAKISENKVKIQDKDRQVGDNK